MRTRTGHVVVDGSNIATEGRSMPSLSQLNEAVLAFLAEFPGVTVTVVVDATFGHRIDKSEVKEFDSAIANNELVAPPAGAVGRGDAFVLSIANKAGAAILSNDSFQEFHGDYTWLFDEGRLVGGKPVPHVGWVFVDRVPVRGPVSRKAVRESQSDGDAKRSGGGRARRSRGGGAGVARTGSKEATQPMPVPKSPPPGKAAARRAADAAAAASVADESSETTSRSRRSGRGRGAGKSAPTDTATPTSDTSTSAPKSGESVNDLMAFLDFVEHHPVGTSVNAIVENYSSHGAYVRIGEVRGYVPLRLMGDPPPRSAREVMKIDDAVTLVVASFAPARRSIDCALPDMATDLESQDQATVIEETTTAAGAAGELTEPATPPEKTAPTKKAAAQKASARKTPAKKASAKKSAPGKKAPAKKVPAKQAPVDEPAAEPAPSEHSPTEHTPAKKSPAKKSSSEKAAVKKAAVKKAAAKKTVAKKAVAKKAPTKKAPAKSSAAKKSAAKKAPAAKAAARRTSRSTASTGDTSSGQ